MGGGWGWEGVDIERGEWGCERGVGMGGGGHREGGVGVWEGGGHREGD